MIKKKELRSFHVGGVEGYEYRARGMKLEKLRLCLSADGNCFCRESHRENRFPPFAHSTLAIRYYTDRLSDRAIETCAARITSLPFLATKTERLLRVRVLRIPSVRKRSEHSPQWNYFSSADRIKFCGKVRRVGRVGEIVDFEVVE